MKRKLIAVLIGVILVSPFGLLIAQTAASAQRQAAGYTLNTSPFASST